MEERVVGWRRGGLGGCRAKDFLDVILVFMSEIMFFLSVFLSLNFHNFFLFLN